MKRVISKAGLVPALAFAAIAFSGFIAAAQADKGHGTYDNLSDGQRIKPFDGTFTNLTPGQHEICIAATTKNHKPLGLEDHGEVNTAYPCFDKTTDTTSGVFDVVPVLFSPSLVVFLSEGKPTCYG